VDTVSNLAKVREKYKDLVQSVEQDNKLKKSMSFCSRSICGTIQEQAAELTASVRKGIPQDYSDNKGEMCLEQSEKKFKRPIKMPLLDPLEDRHSIISGLQEADEWAVLEKYDVFKGYMDAKEKKKKREVAQNMIKAELDRQT
jgi:hypothetical protein